VKTGSPNVDGMFNDHVMKGIPKGAQINRLL
jgi:hypothetical protein